MQNEASLKSEDMLSSKKSDKKSIEITGQDQLAIPAKTLTTTKSVERLSSFSTGQATGELEAGVSQPVAKKENLSDSGVLTTEQAEDL